MAVLGRVVFIGKESKTLISLLQEEGLEVASALSPQELSQLLKEREFDLVLINAGDQPRRYQEAIPIIREIDPQLSILFLVKGGLGGSALEVAGGFAPGPLKIENLPRLIKKAVAQSRLFRHRGQALSLNPLLELAQVAETTSLEECLSALLSKLGEITQADQGQIILIKEGKGQVASSWRFPEALGGRAYPEALVKRVSESKEAICLTEGKAEDLLIQQELMDWNLSSVIAFPLKEGEQVKGVLLLNRIKGEAEFSEYERKVVLATCPLFTRLIAGNRKEELDKLKEQLEWRKQEITALNELLQKQNTQVIELSTSYHSLESRYLNCLKFLAQALDNRLARPGYSEEVARWLIPLAEQMGLGRSGLAELAYLHDLGLFFVEPPLEAIRFEAVDLPAPAPFFIELPFKGEDSHPLEGERLARKWGFPEEIAKAIRYHHKNYDGSGFPEGLAGDKIPLLSRLLRVVTSYVEWKLPKPGTTPPSEEEVISQLKGGMGKTFDPAVVRAFLTVLGRREEVREAELISTLSHELRSPLTFILGYSELLSQREDTPPEVKGRLQEICGEVSHMSRMVEELLDLSRWESGQRVPKLEACQLREIIEHAVTKARALTNKHEIKVQLPPVLPLIKADKDQIEQVLDNLLSNAINYSEGGAITVRAEVEGNKMKVSVSDQGIGIPQAELGKIFERFYRVESPLKHKVGGAGLGLSICQHIIKAHGGEIWAESSGEGKGSTFYFTLPLFA